MREYKHNQAKKAFYLFLSLLLGVFVFFILHRLIILFIISFYLSTEGSAVYTAINRQFLAWDYSTLFLSVIAGSLYGLWVGGYWYEKVYEIGFHGGALGHLAVALNRFTKKQSSLRNRVDTISRELRDEAWQLEDLVKMVPKKLQPIKTIGKQATSKRVARKKI